MQNFRIHFLLDSFWLRVRGSKWLLGWPLESYHWLVLYVAAYGFLSYEIEMPMEVSKFSFVVYLCIGLTHARVCNQLAGDFRRRRAARVQANQDCVHARTTWPSTTTATTANNINNNYRTKFQFMALPQMESFLRDLLWAQTTTVWPNVVVY